MKAAVPNFQSVFVYGTLMAPSVVTTLLGRMPMPQPAKVTGYIRRPVVDRVYPGLIVKPDHVTQGILYADLSNAEMEILDWFEDDDYAKQNVEVLLDNGAVMPTRLYLWTNPLSQLDLSKEWDFEVFKHEHLDRFLMHTVRPTKMGLVRRGL